MNAWPVIGRELQAQARRWTAVQLRLAGAGLALCVLAVATIDPEQSAARLGSRLFAYLHSALYLAVWLWLPVPTADALSGERREGTLGLLLLTPLTARGVVLGKYVSHAWRGVTMILAAVPVLALPFTLGGLAWLDVLTSVAFLVPAALCSLAVGLAVSAGVSRRSQAMVLGGLANSLLLLLAILAFGVALQSWFRWTVGIPAQGSRWDELGQSFVTGLVFVFPGLSDGRTWSQFLRVNVGMPFVAIWPWFVAGMSVAGLLFAGGCLELATRILARTWNQWRVGGMESPLQRLLFEPFMLRGQVKRAQKRLLESNPFAWIQQHSPLARGAKWGGCLAALVLGGVTLSLSGSYVGLGIFAVVIVAAMVGSSADSFNAERRSGALELLLTTPLTSRQLLLGRLRGLWSLFVPSVAVTLLFPAILKYPWESNWPLPVTLATGVVFVGLPVIGLCCRFLVPRTLLATACTCLAGLGLPAVAAGLVENRYGLPGGNALLVLAGVHALLAVAAGIFLLHGVDRRHARWR